MEPVTVHFRLSEQEWVAAHSRLLRGMALMRAATLLSACAGALLLLAALLSPGSSVGLLLSYGPIFLAVFALYYYVFSWAPRRHYRADRKFRDGVTFTFAEDHFTVRGKYAESKIDWGLYTGVVEAGAMYVLIYGQDAGTLTPIPKRAFRSERDERAFRSVVFARLGKRLEGRRDGAVAPPEDDYSPAALQPPDWR